MPEVTRARIRLLCLAWGAGLAALWMGCGEPDAAPPEAMDATGPHADIAVEVDTQLPPASSWREAGTVGVCVPFTLGSGDTFCLMSEPQQREAPAGMATFQAGLARADLPESVDHRAYLDGCLGVHDQGDCGWCVAHATTAAIEALVCRDGGDAEGVSEPHLWSMGTDQEITDCAGGWQVGGAYDAWASAGRLVDAETWPYACDGGVCSAMEDSRPDADALLAAGVYSVGPVGVGAVEGGDVDALKAALADGFNVTYAVAVFRNSGWCDDATAPCPDVAMPDPLPPELCRCQCPEAAEGTACTACPDEAHCLAGFHAVVMVGYDDADGGWFTFLNSWGTGFGDGGYGRMAYDAVAAFGLGGNFVRDLTIRCIPDCDASECGADGCGGSCGDCASSHGDSFVCSQESPSTPGVCECVPDCTDRVCGDDGCGGSCGTCEVGACDTGQCECVESCVDDVITYADCSTLDCGGEDALCVEVNDMLLCGCEPTCDGDVAVGVMCEPTDCAAMGSHYSCEQADALALPLCVCTPDCTDRVCGDDGCGGSCGTCEVGACDTGQCECVEACVDDVITYLDCSTWDCAAEGTPCVEAGGLLLCGCEAGCDGDVAVNAVCESTDCAAMGANYSCEQGGPTESPACVCTPDCTDKVCGGDGCGGSCGDCGAGVCDSGQCECTEGCTEGVITYSDCSTWDCGAEGTQCIQGGGVLLCGCYPGCDGDIALDAACVETDCGALGAGSTCAQDGTLTTPYCECVPDCAGKECGDDGCGGSCGVDCAITYAPQFVCNDGACECAPACGDAVCGGDGCGGSCGTCDYGGTCSAGACTCERQCDEDVLILEDCTEWFCTFFGFATCGVAPPDFVPECQ